MEKYIIYDNRKFTLESRWKKYYGGRVDGVRWALHRYKYTKEVGPIPEGWHIHHKDYNPHNNDISNLQALSPEDHAAFHLPSKELIRKWQSAGIKEAPVWHASEDGATWHKQHYKEKLKSIWEVRVKCNCANCNSEMESKRKKVNTFCSNKCKSAWRRKNKPDKKIVLCPVCQKEFETLKYLPNTYCSKECKPAPNPFGQKGKNKLP